ncbi:MAG TPA: response regulator transcription factor [Actinomycetota bacterium]|nr:response regulator transcription factor [Actinomycetota bacterium]
MISVLIADDQELVREGLRTILDAQDDIEVVGEANTGAQAVRLVRELRPDVAVLDVRMPEMDGIEATRQLLSAGDLETRVLMLTTFDLDEYVYEALRAGASGFMLKDVPRRQLIEAIRTVVEGDGLLAPAITRRLIADFVKRPHPNEKPPELQLLTERELEVFELAALGLTNAEIGEKLFLSESTVKTHFGQVLAKLGVRDRVQVVIYAYESGSVRPGEQA